MAMKQIDIEDLLVWTYQNQCADKLRLQSFSQASAMDSCRRLELAAVDGGTNVGHECHPDAEAVHFAVLRLSKVQQALVIGNAKNGTRPDCLAGAKLVMAAAVNSQGNPKRLYDASRNFIGHAIKPAIEMPDGKLFDLPKDPFKLVQMSFEQVVGSHRDQYAAWHEALSSLTVYLNGGAWLSDYVATGPSASDRPWDRDMRSSAKAS